AGRDRRDAVVDGDAEVGDLQDGGGIVGAVVARIAVAARDREGRGVGDGRRVRRDIHVDRDVRKRGERGERARATAREWHRARQRARPAGTGDGVDRQTGRNRVGDGDRLRRRERG